MTLVSVTPGDPTRLRVYACAPHSRLRTRLADIKVEPIPNAQEVEALRKQPLQIIAALDFSDGAA